jgi:hypothetical protein
MLKLDVARQIAAERQRIVLRAKGYSFLKRIDPGRVRKHALTKH